MSKKKIYVIAGLLGLVTIGSADSWTLLQSTSVEDAALVQSGNKANQAVNAINLSNTASTLNNAEQTTSHNGKSVTLTQESGASNSKQGLNLINADKIESAKQTISDAGNVTLRQSSSNNKQAANIADANQIENLSQSLKLINGGDLNLLQNGTSNGLQAGNLANTNSITSGVNQTLVADEVVFSQSDSSNSIQAGNMVTQSGGVIAGSVTQSFSANKVTISSENNENATQTANYVSPSSE